MRLAGFAAVLRDIEVDRAPPVTDLVAGGCVGPVARGDPAPSGRRRPARPLPSCSRLRPRKGEKRGELTGPSPVDRGKPGSKMHVLSDANGLPIVVGLSAASTHDSLALKPVIQGHKRDTTPTAAGTSSPDVSTQTRPTTSLTCENGCGASTSVSVSPARESSPANGWGADDGSSNAPCPG